MPKSKPVQPEVLKLNGIPFKSRGHMRARPNESIPNCTFGAN